MPTTTPVAPAVNGQVVGLAHYASRAVLERVLARSGTTFQQSLALGAVAGSGDAVDRDQLVTQMIERLKIDESAALETIAELTASGLLESLPAEESRLRLTDAGRTLSGEIRAAGAEIAARLYRDIPAEDLAAAARVLTLVTARANAELAGAEQ
ncbi:MarR family winged helix-turn-helix transcriptional regulator [Streptomyces sp. NPDC087512]|uniref:MarR family winged helix-turn-helix transcriptional regulator n=1 Tax=Streptomyces sp. NPDC087512 TaxID=3155059 RepID=UPI003429A9AC